MSRWNNQRFGNKEYKYLCENSAGASLIDTTGMFGGVYDSGASGSLIVVKKSDENLAGN